MAETEFERRSTEIVSEFLTTAIVIDDQAYFGGPQAGRLPASPQVLAPPRRQAADADTGASPSQLNSVLLLDRGAEDLNADDPDDHRLDAKRLIDRFGEQGIVCSVIRPDDAEMGHLNAAIERLARVADVFVLDWVFHGDATGAKAKDLIRLLVSDSSNGGQGRFRLVVVYTAETDLEQVTADVKKDFAYLSADVKKDGFSISLVGTGTRVVIYGKPNSKRTAPARERSITPDALPGVVVREFTEVTRGLLPNAAMASVAAIRRNTHQLLTRFPSNLDPAFVTQSILMCPERASEQVVDLIVAEIGSILEDAEIFRHLEADALKAWLEQRIASNTSVPPSGCDLSKEEFRSGFECLIDGGANDETGAVLEQNHGRFRQSVIGSVKKPKLAPSLTGFLSTSVTEKAGDAQLALLMSLRHRYEGAKPRLTLGTIVSGPGTGSTSDADTYFICLQPVCDSVRVMGNRSFPFLPLEKASKKDDDDDLIIVGNGNEMSYLRCRCSPHQLRMVEFGPVERDLVIAEEQAGGLTFTSTEPKVYRWIADLKPAHAQRIAHRLGTAISRVGLVESEWGRHWQGGN